MHSVSRLMAPPFPPASQPQKPVRQEFFFYTTRCAAPPAGSGIPLFSSYTLPGCSFCPASLRQRHNLKSRRQIVILCAGRRFLPSRRPQPLSPLPFRSAHAVPPPRGSESSPPHTARPQLLPRTRAPRPYRYFPASRRKPSHTLHTACDASSRPLLPSSWSPESVPDAQTASSAPFWKYAGKFQNQNPVHGQHLFKGINVMITAGGLISRHLMIHPIPKHLSIPASVKKCEFCPDRDLRQNRHIYGCRSSSGVAL